jgi:hypothetical protein
MLFEKQILLNKLLINLWKQKMKKPDLAAGSL